MNKEVDHCRRSLRRKYPKDDTLKHLRWVLLKPADHLEQDDREKLEQALAKPEYEIMHRTWKARNEFRDILESDASKQEAEELILQWEQRHTATPNRYVQRFVNFLQNWKNYILNYFVHRYTTSPVEGINNKLKVIKRRAYGFLTFEAFRIRAILEFN